MNKQIEAIRTEIDKLYAEYKDKFHQHGDQYHLGLIDGLDMAERVLDTLSEEQPKEICHKCIHHGKDDGYCYNPHGGIKSRINENGVYDCNDFVEQEQPEVDLEKEEQPKIDWDSEIEEYWIATGWSKIMTLGKFKVIARYFIGLALNARKEE